MAELRNKRFRLIFQGFLFEATKSTYAFKEIFAPSHLSSQAYNFNRGQF